MSLSAVGESLPQALAIAVSPVPVALLLLMLVSDRGRVNGPAFAVGWTSTLLVAAGTSLRLSDAGDVAGESGAGGGGIRPFHLLLGLFFVLLAALQWRRRPKRGEEPARPRLFDLVDSFGPGRALGLGVATVLLNLKDLTLAIDAGVAIAQTGVEAGEATVAVVVFALVASSTVLVPVAAVLLLGDRTTGPLHRLKDWLLAHNATILLVLFVALAARFLVSGLGLAG